MMTEQSEFDPRFDPAFQQGYEPSTQPRAAPRHPARADVIGERPPSSELQRDDGTSLAAAPAAERRGINPYVVILWVIGVIFTIGGAALLFVTYLRMFRDSSGPTPQDPTAQTLYVLGSAFSVPLVTVGLATVAGLLFMSAWRARHPREAAGS